MQILRLERGVAMAWHLSEVRQTQVANFETRPGFSLQQEGRSPSLTLVFDEERKAHTAREMMQQAISLSSAVFPGPRTA